jgi:hypothetical protein
MNDKGCPGERLKTVPGKMQTRQAVRFPVVLGRPKVAATLHVRVVCFGFKTGSYRQSRTSGV